METSEMNDQKQDCIEHVQLYIFLYVYFSEPFIFNTLAKFS